MKYKKAINIVLRCLIYVYLVSRILNPLVAISFSGECFAIKTFFDVALLEMFGLSLKFTQNLFDIFEAIIVVLNLLFFPYFFAKLCGLYKLFKNNKLWQRNLIFLLLTALILPFAMFDFKNFKIFDEFFIDNNSLTTYFTMFCSMLAFYLNLFFEFLTKKFPKPFEKIGYFFSIEFCKNLFKRKKKS